MKHRGGEGKHQHALWLLKDYLWEGIYECVFLYFCAHILDISLAIVLKNTGRFLPLTRCPFPPLIVAPWVQADSSSCLFSLIYQARDDKCNHLPVYPPLLGGLGSWMCSIFFILMWWINACPKSSLLGHRVLSHLTQNHFLQPASEQVLK